MERKRSFWPYVIFIFLALLTGGLATLVSLDGMKAYRFLPQSPLTPPPVVFSPRPGDSRTSICSSRGRCY